MTVTKKHVKYRWVALGLLLAVLVTSFPLMALADGSSTLNALDITSDDRAYDWVTHGKTTYTYDFSATDITVYSKDEALATSSLRTNMIFDGQTLSCKEGKPSPSVHRSSWVTIMASTVARCRWMRLSREGRYPSVPASPALPPMLSTVVSGLASMELIQ